MPTGLLAYRYRLRVLLAATVAAGMIAFLIAGLGGLMTVIHCAYIGGLTGVVKRRGRGTLTVVVSVAAQGLQKLKWFGAILALWLLADSALAHPDYLSWMNAAAGRHPERVLSDSNLDWGQDLIRLRNVCRANHIDDLGMLVFTRADLNALGFRNVHHIDPHNPSPGWFAVSETEIAIWNGWDPKAYRWLLDRRNFTRVGTSIRLYRVTR